MPIQQIKLRDNIYLMTEEFHTVTSNLIQKCLTIVQSLLALGDSQQSIELIEALLEADPKHPQLHKKKAFALISSSRYEEALQSLDTCIENSNNMQKSECLVHKADLLYSLQRYSQSLKIYQLLLIHNPNRQQILYRKGLCILALSKYKEASNIFQKVLSLNANYQQCYVMVSSSYFMQRKYKKSLNYLIKISQNKGFQNTDALYMKACCYYNLKQFNNCQKELKNILQIDNSHIQSKVLLIILKAKRDSS